MPSSSTSSVLNRKNPDPPYITRAFLRRFAASSLKEDQGDADHTSLACIPAGARGEARLLVKEPCIIAGVELAKAILKYASPGMKFGLLKRDGMQVDEGDIVFTVSGPVRHLLLCERTLLNVMQRMSGIATRTRRFADACAGTKARILDTRKTTPGFRIPEKWAVHIGGGLNHRMGLYDMILIKDNHIDFCGGVVGAVVSARDYLRKKKKKLRITVEARNMDEVEAILRVGGVHRILLDNMSPAQVAEAVRIIGGRVETEASGGISEENIRSYALTGVNFISVGSLTHHVRSVDLSFKATIR